MPVTLEDLVQQASRATQAVSVARELALAPTLEKIPPMIGSAELQGICGISPHKLKSMAEAGKLPASKKSSSLHARWEFTLAELQVWAKALRKKRMRPEGADAAVVTVANFKGGVSKTTSAVTLAQGLSMRGHRVLFIDLDPQGSATALFALQPGVEVDDDTTALGVFEGEETSIIPAVRETYWPGVDLVAASLSLYGAEFALPARQKGDPGFEFWTCLDLALDEAREHYDVIVIDTPPSLSYTTINALHASDGVLIPLPPSMLDFASSAQFWNLFSDLCQQLYKGPHKKEFSFIDVLLAKVDAGDSATPQIRQFIAETYAGRVLPIEIPKTAATTNASTALGTIYDAGAKAAVGPKTYARARLAYDAYVELIEDRLQTVWQSQLDLVRNFGKKSHG